jgi:hypothetical protein
MRRGGQNEMRFAGQKRCGVVAKLMRRTGQKPCAYAIVKLEKSNRADLVRFALKFFMESYALGNVDARESQLDRRLQQVDKHLSSLLVKAIKVSGQNLYWSMLPFTKGPPQRRLNEDGLQMLRDSALSFALGQLSAKQKVELEEVSE